MKRFGLVPVLVAASMFMAWGPEAFAKDCPVRPNCKGCGCKGGPGYRGPDGRCVGFKLLDRICGSPPEMRCVFENAPGTGMNRECALAPARPDAPTAPVGADQPEADPVSPR